MFLLLNAVANEHHFQNAVWETIEERLCWTKVHLFRYMSEQTFSLLPLKVCGLCFKFHQKTNQKVYKESHHVPSEEK